MPPSRMSAFKRSGCSSKRQPWARTGRRRMPIRGRKLTDRFRGARWAKQTMPQSDAPAVIDPTSPFRAHIAPPGSGRRCWSRVSISRTDACSKTPTPANHDLWNQWNPAATRLQPDRCLHGRPGLNASRPWHRADQVSAVFVTDTHSKGHLRLGLVHYMFFRLRIPAGVF
jgi:hypothetical protein